ncbi:MAG: hypothetical protein NTW69_06330 [Chloroflexi bacterium]|nr:hypothetical protein [Chloroflexota bacterium]
MATMNNTAQIKEYETSVGALGEFGMSVITDAFYALIERDSIFEKWKTLSESEKKNVALLDEILKNKRLFVAKILPSKNSTPQARAEGRWWWFLNE